MENQFLPLIWELFCGFESPPSQYPIKEKQVKSFFFHKMFRNFLLCLCSRSKCSILNSLTKNNNCLTRSVCTMLQYRLP